MAISAVTVRLHGTVAPDITEVRIAKPGDATPTVISTATVKTWEIQVTVPGGSDTVTVTAIGATRTETRAIEVHGSAVALSAVG